MSSASQNNQLPVGAAVGVCAQKDDNKAARSILEDVVKVTDGRVDVGGGLLLVSVEVIPSLLDPDDVGVASLFESRVVIEAKVDPVGMVVEFT